MDRAQSVQLDLDAYKNTLYFTHGFHPYPAKFIPQIPHELIEKLADSRDWVLDPFCGSGTTLVESRVLGRHAVGVDVNPLSCLISRVKTTVLTERQHRIARDIVLAASDTVQRRPEIQVGRFEGIDRWFKPEIQEELAALRCAIDVVDDVGVREFLLVAFSAVVVKVSNQESDTRYKAIAKDVKRGDPSRLFAVRVSQSLARMTEFAVLAKDSEVRVILGDSTTVELGDIKFDLIVTSPPYMNSYDYYLYHKHRMNWLGLGYRDAQAKEIGSRNKHNDYGLGLEAYNEPIRQVVANVSRNLKRGGYWAVVIGDSILRGELVKMDQVYDLLFANLGFQKVRELKFPLRKYSRAFTPNLRTQHKDFYVLIYRLQ
jgi:site-specific DNA-methyltransferase (cytosine-N4-specific)